MRVYVIDVPTNIKINCNRSDAFERNTLSIRRRMLPKTKNITAIPKNAIPGPRTGFVTCPIGATYSIDGNASVLNVIIEIKVVTGTRIYLYGQGNISLGFENVYTK